jgi:magnesium-transporting ATPase (P-type)
LWINLVATVTLALPLAFEAREPGLMRRPPRDPASPILSRFVLVRTVLVALLMTAAAVGLFLYDYHGQLAGGTAAALAQARAQTIAITTVVLFQCFYLLQCRSLQDSALQMGLWTNPWVYVGIGLLLVLHLCFVYLPFMHRLFGSAPLDGGGWLRAVLAALVVLPVIYAEKAWHKRRTRSAATTPVTARAREQAADEASLAGPAFRPRPARHPEH